MQKLKIELVDHGRGRVFVDGVEVQQCTGVKFSARAGELNVAEISFIPHTVEIDGPVRVADVTPLNHNGARRFDRALDYPNDYFARKDG